MSNPSNNNSARLTRSPDIIRRPAGGGAGGPMSPPALPRNSNGGIASNSSMLGTGLSLARDRDRERERDRDRDRDRDRERRDRDRDRMMYAASPPLSSSTSSGNPQQQHPQSRSIRHTSPSASIPTHGVRAGAGEPPHSHSHSISASLSPTRHKSHTSTFSPSSSSGHERERPPFSGSDSHGSRPGGGGGGGRPTLPPISYDYDPIGSRTLPTIFGGPHSPSTTTVNSNSNAMYPNVESPATGRSAVSTPGGGGMQAPPSLSLNGRDRDRDRDRDSGRRSQPQSINASTPSGGGGMKLSALLSDTTPDDRDRSSSRSVVPESSKSLGHVTGNSASAVPLSGPPGGSGLEGPSRSNSSGSLGALGSPAVERPLAGGGGLAPGTQYVRERERQRERERERERDRERDREQERDMMRSSSHPVDHRDLDRTEYRSHYPGSALYPDQRLAGPGPGPGPLAPPSSSSSSVMASARSGVTASPGQGDGPYVRDRERERERDRDRQRDDDRDRRMAAAIERERSVAANQAREASSGFHPPPRGLPLGPSQSPMPMDHPPAPPPNQRTNVPSRHSPNQSPNITTSKPGASTATSGLGMGVPSSAASRTSSGFSRDTDYAGGYDRNRDLERERERERECERERDRERERERFRAARDSLGYGGGGGGGGGNYGFPSTFTYDTPAERERMKEQERQTQQQQQHRSSLEMRERDRALEREREREMERERERNMREKQIILERERERDRELETERIRSIERQRLREQERERDLQRERERARERERERKEMERVRVMAGPRPPYPEQPTNSDMLWREERWKREQDQWKRDQDRARLQQQQQSQPGKPSRQTIEVLNKPSPAPLPVPASIIEAHSRRSSLGEPLTAETPILMPPKTSHETNQPAPRKASEGTKENAPSKSHKRKRSEVVHPTNAEEAQRLFYPQDIKEEVPRAATSKKRSSKAQANRQQQQQQQQQEAQLQQQQQKQQQVQQQQRKQQQQQQQPPPPPPVIMPQVAQIDYAMLAAPPLRDLEVRSEPIERYLRGLGLPALMRHLGKFIYRGVGWMIDEATLADGVGASLEVEIPGTYLPRGTHGQSGWSIKGEQDWATVISMSSRKTLEAIPGFCDRRIWGTDVYTDDSDLVAVLVHAAWLRPVFDQEQHPMGAAKTADTIGDDLRVTLRIAPKLVRYISTERNGIRSRGWGNSHDGVSIVIENVERIKRGTAVQRSRRNAKERLALMAQERANVFHRVIADEEIKSSPVLRFLSDGTPGFAYERSAFSTFHDVNGQDTKKDEARDKDKAVWTNASIFTHDLLLENDKERYRCSHAHPTRNDSQMVLIAVQPTDLTSSSVKDTAEMRVLATTPLSCIKFDDNGILVKVDEIDEVSMDTKTGEIGEAQIDMGFFAAVNCYAWVERKSEGELP